MQGMCVCGCERLKQLEPVENINDRAALSPGSAEPLPSDWCLVKAQCDTSDRELCGVCVSVCVLLLAPDLINRAWNV